jgi:hypothetical protein
MPCALSRQCLDFRETVVGWLSIGSNQEGTTARSISDIKCVCLHLFDLDHKHKSSWFFFFVRLYRDADPFLVLAAPFDFSL